MWLQSRYFDEVQFGLGSDKLDMARHAIDVTVCEPIGSSNLTEVRKALSSPSDGPAIGEPRK
jgi:hypothetical protein